MARTTIDIDDELLAQAMKIYRFKTKREAVNHALGELVGEPRGELVGEPMTREEMLAMQGSGWDGDLEEIRHPDDVPIL